MPSAAAAREWVPGCVGLPLQQLRLSCCTLLDGVAGLAAALALLPELHHLVLIRLISESGCYAGFPSSALISVPQLTYLDWVGGAWQDPGGLQHLQRLTRLQHLQLCTYDQHTVQASSLSGLELDMLEAARRRLPLRD